MIDRKEQVKDQCRVVAHMCSVVGWLYRDRSQRINEFSPIMLDIVGRHSAELIEVLGNAINGMDAATEEDEWTFPIIERSQTMFPPTPSGEGAGDE